MANDPAASLNASFDDLPPVLRVPEPQSIDSSGFRLAMIRPVSVPQSLDESALIELPPCDPTGEVAFVLRGSLEGLPRFLTERDIARYANAVVPSEGALRGSVTLTGPPAHNLCNAFWPDLPAFVGELLRAVAHIGEPGTAMEFVVPLQPLRVSLTHTDRVVNVAMRNAAGGQLSSRAYEAFSFIDGITAAGERLERLLRARGLKRAYEAMYRRVSRVAFPRLL